MSYNDSIVLSSGRTDVVTNPTIVVLTALLSNKY